MLRNSDQTWGSVSRWLHWGFAVAITGEVVAGIVMSRTFGTKEPGLLVWHGMASNIHHTAGLLLLGAAFLRGLWRLTGPVPVPIGSDSVLERGAARAVHWLLYALLFLIPLSGWAALSALADSPEYGRTVIWFFGMNGFDVGIPRIVPPVPWDSEAFFRYSTFAKGHRWMLYIGAAVLALHVVAALRHHFVLKNHTLRRMASGRVL